MNYYDGILFFLFLGPVLFGAFCLGVLEKSLGWYGLGASVLAAAFIFAGKPSQFAALCFFLVWSFVLLFWYQNRRRKAGRQAGIYHLALALSLLPLALAKLMPLLTLDLAGFTGVSYLTFRVTQMVIEIYDGSIQNLSWPQTAAFLLFFPSFSAGPIDRSRRFEKDFSRSLSREEYESLCADGLLLLLRGAVYKFVLSAWLFKAMTGLASPDALWYHKIAYAYTYSFYLFFDFAGYSAMAVGSAKVLGVDLPMNFNAPFLARDIRDFWDRWHISLSHWFRDYLFTRFVMFSTRKKWFGSRLGRAVAGFVVNMAVMGLWHGLNAHYLAYGLYHGLLLSGNEVWQKRSRFYKKHGKEGWYGVCSWFVTIQLVVFGFYIFSGG